MTESPRAKAPEPVDRLWSMIEDYCEIHDRNRRPVRRIARMTGLSRSTISDWFNYRSFPQWEPFSQLLGYFKNDDLFRGDLEIMWKAAWGAHQTARGREVKTGNRFRLSWVAVGLVALAVAVAGAFVALRHPAAAASGDSAAPAVGIVGGVCMAVSASDVRVFVAPAGNEVWTSWAHDTKFWADRDAASPSRYRTTLRNGRHGWVTRDRRYVQPADGCA